MKSSLRYILLPFIIIVVIFAIFRLAPKSMNGEFEVATTIFPVYDIALNIAPSDINVLLILEPGASPHTFEPSPSLIRSLQSTQVIYTIDPDLDGWATELVETDTVTLSQDLDLIENIDLDEHEDEHGHEGENPHYWLSIPYGQEMARIIAADLTTRFPEYEEEIASRLTAYLAELDQAHLEVTEMLSEKENRNIITFHDSWDYFAETYNLNIVGTFEPTAGREPTPQYLVELMQAIEISQSTTLYSEPQLATASIQSFADDHDLTIATLDPLGGTEGRMTYIDLMLYNAKTFQENN
jgi:zinc transport system substrate-binding protein